MLCSRECTAMQDSKPSFNCTSRTYVGGKLDVCICITIFLLKYVHPCMELMHMSCRLAHVQCPRISGSLMAFRGEDITEDEIKKLEPIVGDEGFTVENMKSKSAAAANLCSWVISIYTYNRIYVKVCNSRIYHIEESK